RALVRSRAPVGGRCVPDGTSRRFSWASRWPGSEQPEGQGRYDGWRQRCQYEPDRAYSLAVEVAAQYGYPRRVGGVGDDREPASGDGTSDESVLESVGQPFDQRTEVRERRVVRECGEGGSAEEHLVTRHAQQHRLQPPLLKSSEDHEARQEERDQQPFAQDQAVLVTLVRRGHAQEQQEDTHEQRRMVGERDDTDEEGQMHYDQHWWHPDPQRPYGRRQMAQLTTE